jgi:hypothetical protein
MSRSVLVCVAILCLVGLPGCSANPAYESIFQDLLASVRRATTAMNSARDANSVKESSELLLKEAASIDELSKKLSQLGKPNSTSKKVAKKYLDELAAMDEEIDQVSKQFSKAITTAPLSHDDRLTYAMASTIFAQALTRFGLAASVMENDRSDQRRRSSFLPNVEC